MDSIVESDMAGKIKIVVIKHPLIVERGRIVESIEFEGQNLRDIIDEYAADVDCPVVRINGSKLPAVERNEYDYKLRPGDEIIIVPGIRDPVTMIWSVATWVATTIGYESVGAMLWAAAVNIGISIGISYLIRALGPSPDDIDSAEVSPSFGWSPVTTQRQGLVIPRVYGEIKLYGNIIAGWTSPDGATETLNMLISLGEGPVEGIDNTSIQVNDQPVGSYSGINIYEARGTLDQGPIFSSLKLEYRPNRLVRNDGGPQTWTTPDDDFDKLEIAVKYSGYHFYKDGDQGWMGLTVKIEISEHDADSWSTLVHESLTCQQNPEQKNYVSDRAYSGGSPVTITNGKRYDVRVTKTSADRDYNRSKNRMDFASVREVISTPFTYPGLALVGVEALASDEISGSVKISVNQQGRICNVYDGSFWSLEWTDNPAWVIWDLLTLPVISGNGGDTAFAIERYDGIDPERLTPYLAEWLEAADYYDDLISDGDGGTEKRITFNGVFDAGTTVWDAVNKVCAMARCEVLRIGRDYTIIVDKPYAGDAVQLFSAGNIKPGSFRNSYIDISSRASELEIDFLDRAIDYEMTPLLYVDPAIEAGEPKTITGFGVTRATQAWRLCYYELAKNRILKYTPEFKADIDAIVCRKGDIVLVVEPWKLGGRVVATPANNQVELDAEPSISAADTIAIRMVDPATGRDKVETHTVDSVAGTTVTITDTWSVTPRRDDLYAFGPTAEILKKFRVVGISRASEHTHKIRLIEYNDDIYDGDDAEPDIWIRDYEIGTSGYNPTTIPPLSLDDVLDIIPVAGDIVAAYDNFPVTSNLGFSDTTEEELYENHESGGDTSYTIGQTGYSVTIAQTFTAESDHSIGRVELELFDQQGNGITGDIDIAIKATDVNGLPTGADLATGTIDAADLNPGHYSDTYNDIYAAFNGGKIYFSPDGVYLYTLTGGINNILSQYYLSDPWDIESAAIVQSVNLSDKGVWPPGGGIFFKPDGSTLYVLTYDYGWFGDIIYTMSLSTAWDISTLGFAVSNSIWGAIFSTHYGLWFSEDGTKLYWCYTWPHVSPPNDVWVLEFTMSTPWDVSSASPTASNNIALYNYTDHAGGLAFRSDGKKVAVIDRDNELILFWNLPTAWTLSGESKDSYELDMSDEVVSVVDIHAKNSLKTFFVPDSGIAVREFNVPMLRGDWQSCDLSSVIDLTQNLVYVILAAYADYEEGVSEPEWVTNEDGDDNYAGGTFLRHDGSNWYDS